MENNKYDWIEQELNKIKEQGLYINVRTVESSMAGKIKVDGKELLNFCANNYLGLANNERIISVVKKAIDEFGIGPGAVRTIAGNHKLHNELERKIALFKGSEDCIVLQSGFTANLAVIPAITQEGSLVFSDELNHASIIDGCKLSKASIIRYSHCNMLDLREKISAADPNAKKLIITDGVFSMDGDIAPLADLYHIAQEFNAMIMVDDAHGEGVLGNHGRGVVDHFGLHGKIDIEVGTLSKAFGVVGGYITGRKTLIDWLRQRGRPFLFSSALTIPDTAASIESVNILSESDELIKKLWHNTILFKEEMKKLGFDIGRSQTPIVPVMLGDAQLAKDFSQKLFEQGLFATAITYPTVAEGAARVRVMMSADHEHDDIYKALEIFKNVGSEFNLIS